jgi:hypothetical protein
MKFSAIALSAIILSLAAAAPASADNGNWKKNHPRRAEVNRRDQRLHNRTERAEKNGKLTNKQGEKLEGEEAAIRGQEKADAAAHGGHITKGEQRELNKEENGVRREMNRDERQNRRSKKGVPVTTAPANGSTTPAAGTN